MVNTLGSEFRDRLVAEFARVGVLSGAQVDLLERHFSLLTEWNQRMNLTRIQDVSDAVRLHYCESLFLGQALPSGNLRIVDVGSGAGFPGIPLAVIRPECQVDLIESNRRKAVFLREACAGIGNIGVIGKRAQEVESRYDWMISRAVRPNEVLGLHLAPRAAILMSAFGSDLGPTEIRESPWGSEHIIAMFHVELGSQF